MGPPDGPAVSVVVSTCDRAQRLSSLLASLRRQALAPASFEVIVVDNASSDDTPKVLAAEAARGELELRIVRIDLNRGPGPARNVGWRAARAPLIAFTDDDCTVTPGWLAAGLEAWGGDPDRIVQGSTEPEPDELDTEGPFSRTMRVRALGPWYQTCNVFYPRALLERVGGFDEALAKAAGEDVDLAWRCLDSGATAVFCPEARVHHAVHDLGPLGKLRVAWRWDEAIRVYARHPGMRSALVYGVFWKKSHYLVVRAALGCVVPRRFGALRFWCFAPLAASYWERAGDEGGARWAAPYFIVHDIVEVAAALRGAIRYRTPVL